MSQSWEPWPCWKTSTTTPKVSVEGDEVEHDGLEREHDRAKRACEQDQRQDQQQSEHVGEAAEERMDEVAVHCRHPGERAVRALRACRVRGRRSSECRAPSRRWRGMPRPASSSPGSTLGARSLRRCPEPFAAWRRSVAASPLRSTSTSSGFITPGLMCASASICAAGDRGAGAREVLELRLVGVAAAFRGPQAARRSQGRPLRPRSGRRSTKRAQRPQAPCSGMAAVDEAARYHAKTVDALSEHGEERG